MRDEDVDSDRPGPGDGPTVDETPAAAGDGGPVGGGPHASTGDAGDARTRGIDADGIDADGIDEGGIDESRIDAGGTDEGGIDMNGIHMRGIDTDGADAAGRDRGDAAWREAFRQGAPAALWQAAVRDAGGRIGLDLDEDCESYLVFVLLRYQREPRFFDGAQALAWLHAQSLAATARAEALRDIGDRCLLLAGLYPGLAERRRVSADYFAQLGRSAYQGVAEASRSAYAALFAQLAQTYRDLVRLLSALPAGAKPPPSLRPALVARPGAAGRLH